MKQSLGFYGFTAAAILLLPAAVLLPQESAEAQNTAVSTSVSAVSAQESAAAENCYHVLDISTGEVLNVPVRDYIIGVVCAEMPATFETEALKAQAVAVHTYAERIRRRSQKFPDASLLGADFSNDSAKYQAYYTDSQLRQAYGDAYDTCYAKVAAAVGAVEKELLCYEGEPIIAAFHAISTGKTESAETVWGEPLAYLVSVDSAADAAAPQYLETVTFSQDELKTAFLQKHPDIVFSEEPSAWCTVLSVSDAGTVLQAQCGNQVLNGQQVREVLKLRSACFAVDYADGVYRFTTKGYGHAVGMSQYGANVMAQNGSGYQEILAHYYPDTTLQSVS